MNNQSNTVMDQAVLFAALQAAGAIPEQSKTDMVQSVNVDFDEMKNAIRDRKAIKADLDTALKGLGLSQNSKAYKVCKELTLRVNAVEAGTKVKNAAEAHTKGNVQLKHRNITELKDYATEGKSEEQAAEIIKVIDDFNKAATKIVQANCSVDAVDLGLSIAQGQVEVNRFTESRSGKSWSVGLRKNRQTKTQKLEAENKEMKQRIEQLEAEKAAAANA